MVIKMHTASAAASTTFIALHVFKKAYKEKKVVVLDKKSKVQISVYKIYI